MPPIPKDQWTDEQREGRCDFAAMRGQEVFGPFAVMLRSPEVMLRAAAMGDYMRYRTLLPPRLNEFIILHHGTALDAAVRVARAPADWRSKPD